MHIINQQMERLREYGISLSPEQRTYLRLAFQIVYEEGALDFLAHQYRDMRDAWESQNEKVGGTTND